MNDNHNEKKKNISLFEIIFIFMLLTLSVSMILLFFISMEKDNMVKVPEQVINVSKYLDNALEIKEENKNVDFRKVNIIYPGFFANKTRIDNYKFIIKDTSLIEGGEADLYFKINGGKLSIVSSYYSKKYCQDLVDISKKDPKSYISKHVTNITDKMLVKYYNLIKKYDVKMNGELITSGKVICGDYQDKKGNVMVISEK